MLNVGFFNILYYKTAPWFVQSDVFGILGIIVVRLINIKRRSILLQKENIANLSVFGSTSLYRPSASLRLKKQRKKALLRLNPRIRFFPPTLRWKRKKADLRIHRPLLQQNEGGGYPIFQ